MLKVNSTLREVIADEVERLNDSRLELVSITGVETSPNLRHALVFIDVLAADASAALAALDRASRRLQSAIAGQVRMKYTPTLEFKIDPGVTGGERIDAILRSLKEGPDSDD
jgi:ribosome-binding factor A